MTRVQVRREASGLQSRREIVASAADVDEPTLARLRVSRGQKRVAVVALMTRARRQGEPEFGTCPQFERSGSRPLEVRPGVAEIRDGVVVSAEHGLQHSGSQREGTHVEREHAVRVRSPKRSDQRVQQPSRGWVIQTCTKVGQLRELRLTEPSTLW